jgi:NAD+ kinase
VFTPVAPHMTFGRTIVAAPDEMVGLRVLPHSGPGVVTVDGQLRGVLEPGDWIGVYAAPYRLPMVRLSPNDFYGRLRERFHLTDAPATEGDGPVEEFVRPAGPVPDELAHLRFPGR